MTQSLNVPSNHFTVNSFTVFCANNCGREVSCEGTQIFDEEGDLISETVQRVERSEGERTGEGVFCTRCVRARQVEAWRDDTVNQLERTAINAGWDVVITPTGASTYLALTAEGRDSIKLRVSDHEQKYEADYSIEFDGLSESAYDLNTVLKAIC